MVLERFLRYVAYDTQSEEGSVCTPSTAKQLVLGELLAKDLAEIGLKNAHMDEFGCVYGWLPASEGWETEPVLGLIAHLDTAPRVSGSGVKPQILRYEGGDLVLNQDKGIVMEEKKFPSLALQRGKRLVVTDGTTLLGADDKAGVAEIFSAMEYLMAHPDISHGCIAICITPDEEVGRGTDHFDLKKFGADAAYTVDGGALGELEYENFNAADGEAVIHGVNIHPGEGKNRMKNSLLIAIEFAGMLPPAETPAHTEGYEGFYHLCTMNGDESETKLSFLIRDHDLEKFMARKQTMERIAGYINTKYGADTVKLKLTDTYYNMKEPLKSRRDLIDRAAAAFRQVGIEPQEVPIRGGTDGARLTYLGLPCPNLSTGGFHFHGIYEYIPVESLEKMTQVLVKLVTGRSEK